jgi:hypothetical protein
MTSTEHRFSGYVLRGGVPDGTIIRGGTPNFVRFEYSNGTADLYKPSGKPDATQPDFERYDLQPITT